MSLEAQQLQLQMEIPIYPLLKVEFDKTNRIIKYQSYC